jgi:REP element-mobilizing transposase RayT
MRLGDKMNKEKEPQRRKELRIKQYDYSSAGAYFVTVCTKDRQKILSNITKPVGVGALDDPLCFGTRLTSIGEIVKKNLLSSENISGVEIDHYAIMPDHIHAIIILYPDKYAKSQQGSSRAPTPTNEMLPHIVSTFKRFCNKEIGHNIFQRGYIEHIIRDNNDYEIRLKYIYENPMRWYYNRLNEENK